MEGGVVFFREGMWCCLFGVFGGRNQVHCRLAKGRGREGR